LAIEPGPDQAFWYVTKAALGRRGPLRRRAPHVVPWPQVAPHFASTPEMAQVAELRDLHPADVVTRLQSLPLARRQQVMAMLADEQVADLLEGMPEEEAVRLIETLDLDRAAHILEEMEPDDAADLLADLEEGDRAELLTRMPVVTVPVMKTHMHTGVSLAVKNMKGALWRRSKVVLHMLPAVPGVDERSLDVAIADMSAALRPHLSLIDGTVGLEGLGPSAGEPRPFGVVVAGVDAYAVDAVACRLMGRRAEAIAHLRLGAARGLGVIDLDRIAVSPAGWADLAIDFAPVPASLTVAFPGVRVLDEASCSACQSTLMLFLRRYGQELLEYFPDVRPVQIAIGKGLERVEPGTICIGNCTRAHRAQGIFVSGCPPVGSAILRTVTGGGDPDDPDPEE
ncbi:MAG TPA: DUF362 domain-containing protein, partial [Polyangiaceae bacterium]|nr:DUF362 domain-containing protein [Polyangiaceae bacterium]